MSRSGSSKTRRARLESGGGSGVGVGGVGSYQTPLTHLAGRRGGEACSGARVRGGRVHVGSVKVPGTGLEGVEV